VSYTTIEIYCTHPCHGNRWVVDEFAQTGPGEWMPLSMMDPHARRLWRPDDAHVPLDAVTNADLRRGFTGPMTLRDRYKFVCRKCKRRGRRAVVEARDVLLGAIFDVLDAHGITSISLAALSARLSYNAGS
jgi:hypothetical protein